MARKRKQDEEGGEVTRCICGHEELHSSAAKKSGVDAGLFIQCDKCLVWQHGYCVGFSSASEVPDVYYCEKCEPQLHEVIERPNGRTSRYLPSERSKRTKRRSSSASDDAGDTSTGADARRPSAEERRRRTLNSREDVILQRVLEQSAQEALEAERRRSAKDEPASSDSDGEPSPKAEIDDRSPSAADETHESEHENEVEVADAEDGAQGDDAEPGAEEVENGSKEDAKSRETTPDEADNEDPEPKAESPELTRKKRRAEPKRPARRRGPVPPAKKAAAAPPLQISKKCKPRIPPPRSTLADMRKRIQAIIEFSGRTQIEMLKEAEARDAFVKDQRSRGAESTAQAMETLCAQHQANIQTLEALARKLLEWQELYG